KLVVRVAWPLNATATVPRMTLPSLKVTVPVKTLPLTPIGVPDPGATASTVAVKVTAWPVTAGVTDDPRATVGGARLTGSATAAQGLAAKAPGAPLGAVTAGVRPPRDTASVAWPAVPTAAVPSTVLPSLKVTVPVGVPAAEFTVAVSNSVCPNTAVGTDVPSVVVVVAAAACPSPRLTVSPIRPAGRSHVSPRSFAPRGFMTSESLSPSASVMLTQAGSPYTVTTPSPTMSPVQWEFSV